MKIDWVFLARHAEVTPEGTMNIFAAGVDSLVVAKNALPARGEIYVAGRVVASMDEWREPDHELTTSVVAPDGSRYGKQRINLQHTQAPPLLEPGAMAGQLLALRQNLSLRTDGTYHVEVVLDEEEGYSLPIIIREVNTERF